MAGDRKTDDGFTPGRFALLLGLMVAGCFPGVLSGGESFVLRDYSIFGYPLAGFHRECVWRGELPLWNPFNHCGLPFLAQWNTLCLYPLSLVYLLPPLTWGLGMFCLLHVFAGGMGAYWLVRDRTSCGFAGAVSGLLYTFGGLSQTSLMWPNNVAALAWMPWVWFLLDRGLSRGGRWLFGAALAGGLQMLCGAPEMIVFTWVIGGAVWLARVRGFRREVFRFAAVVALVSALAAAQLLPFLDLLAASGRGGDGEAIWALPADGWCNLFVPLYRSIHAPSGFWMQVDQFWTVSFYAGSGGIVLALMAWRCRPARREVVAWSLLALVGLALATGEEGVLYPAVESVLPLKFMRYPVKFITLLCVTTPVLAGFGIAALQREWAGRLRGWEWWFVAGMTVWVVARIPAAEDFGELRRDWMDSALLRLVFLACLGGALLLRQVVSTAVGGLAVLLVLLADLRTHSPGLTATVPARIYEEALVGDLPRLGEGRIAASPSVGDGLRRGRSASHEAEAAMRRSAALPNLNLVMGIPSVNGFFSLRLAAEHETTRRHFRGMAEVHAPLADFTGVRRVLIADERGMGWTRRESAEPLVAIGRAPVFGGEQAILRHLASPSFDPRREVLLSANPESLPRVSGDASASVRRVEIGNHRIAFETSAGGFVIATVAQSWHPNWKAFIDGKPAKLLRVNHSFQGVVAPAGEHRVELVYRDRKLLAGAAVSALALAGTLAGLFRRRVRVDAPIIDPPRIPDLV